MLKLPKLPKLPNPEQIPEFFDHITKGIDYASQLVEIVGKGVDKVADALGKEDSPSPPTTKYPSETKTSPRVESSRGVSDEGKTATAELEAPVSAETRGTACLSCARDHFSTASAALSEGMRFAREHGTKHPEVTRRLRIALEELNILERIDLDPSEVVALTAKEREPAEWALASSRDLRHAITDIQDAETMEQAAARASEITEEFMQRYWKLAAECPKCKSIREKAKRFAEKMRGKRDDFSTGYPG